MEQPSPPTLLTSSSINLFGRVDPQLPVTSPSGEKPRLIFPQMLWRWLWLAIFLQIFWALPASARKDHRNVLILNSYHQGYEWSDKVLSGLLASLHQGYPMMDPAIEFLDAKRFPGQAQVERVKRYLADKYRGKKIDLVVVLDNAALNLALHYRRELFPGAPLVFAGINDFHPVMLEGQEKVTGVAEVQDIADTLKLALSLHPDAKEVLVIHDYTTTGLAARREVEAFLPAFKGRAEVRFIPPATFQEILDQVKSLPPGAIGLIMGFATDRRGVSLSQSKSTRLLSAASVPFYALTEPRLGHGIVGGVLLRGREHGQKAGEIALRVLGGEDASRIPVDTKSTAKPMFDYHQLARFGIPLKALPEGSVVINRPLSFYDQNKQWVWGVSAITVFLSLVIFILGTNIMRRRRAEKALLASETALRSVIDCTGEAILTVDTNRVITSFNPAFTRLSGYSAEEAVGQSVALIHPSAEHFHKFGEMVYPAIAATGFWQGEYDIKKKDGTLISTEMSLTPQRLPDGTLTGYIGAHRDINERKRAEEALRESEKRFRHISSTISDISYSCFCSCQTTRDCSFYVDWMVGATERITGYSVEEIMAQRCWRFMVIEEDLPLFDKHVLGLAAGSSGACELRLRHKNGGIVCVHSFAERPKEQDIPNRLYGGLVDISLRKQAEEALRDSEERYRTVADFTYDMEYWLGPDQKLIYMSPSCEYLTGYSREEFFQASNLLQNIVHPEDRGQFAKHGEEARTCQHHLDLDLRLLHRDGREVWISHSCQPVYGLAGQYLGRRVSNRDITARKQVEEALRKNEERFRLLFQNVSDAVFVHEVSEDTLMPGRFIEVNDIACQYLGYSREELLQMHVTQIDAPEVLDDVPSIIRKLIAEGRVMWEGTHLSKDGRRIPVEISNQLFEMQGKQVVFSSVRNISERKQAEEDLRKSENKFSSTFHNAPVIMTLSTIEEGIYLEVNDMFTKVSGFTQEEAVGRTPVELGWVTGKDRRRLIEAMRTEGIVKDTEFELRAKDGRTVFCLYSGMVLSMEGRGMFLSILRDVTPRKRFEEQLQEISQFNKEIIEGAGEGIIVYDRQFRYKLWNKFMEEMTGIKAEQVLNRYALEVFPHLKDQKLDELLGWALNGETVTSKDTPFFIPETGRRGWVEGTYAPQRNAQGEIVGVIAILRDVTPRKRAEQVLRESEDRFRLLVENAPDAICITAEKLFVYLNKEAIKFFGATSEDQLLGRPLLDFIHPDFHDIVQEREQLVYEGKTVPRMEQQYLKIDGTPINAEVSVVPFRYQEKNSGLVFLRDITERKHAEQALRESEERFRLLVENAPDAIFIQTEKRFAYLNKEALKLFGATSEDQLLGRSVMERFHPDFHDIVKERIRLLNEKRKAVPLIEQQYLKLDGIPFDVEVSAEPFRYQEKNGALVFFREITERKQAEKERKILEAHLFQAQKMEALGTLAGGIAHDFNNILGAMTGFAELTAIELPETAEGRYYLENLLKAGDRARHLVKQILSFSRQEKVDRRPMALIPIIKETLKFLRASIPTTIEIRSHLHAEKAIVVADPTQIHQVLVNLATNAAHAMEERGGVLEIILKELILSQEEIVKSPFSVGLQPGAYAELRVGDTGHGMAPEVLERIFDPFFTTKEAGKGTGMGLAVVYGIIKDHGGAVQVNSQPGMGTTFQVLLPAIQDLFAEEAIEISTTLPKGRGRILFVDDDADFFEAGKGMLARLGYEVAAYDSSLLSLDIFKANPDSFDLIICDQTMPGLTGLELAAACSRLRPGIPIILCTGFSEAVTPKKAKAAGIMEVAVKPYNLHQIGKIIKKALKKNQPEAE